MNKTPALINPEILKWVQDQIELTDKQMATLAGVSAKKYRDVIEGKDKLTFDEFRALTKALDLNMAMFYLDEIPDSSFKTLRIGPEDVPFLRKTYDFHLHYDFEERRWWAHVAIFRVNTCAHNINELKENITKALIGIFNDFLGIFDFEKGKEISNEERYRFLKYSEEDDE